MRTIFVFAFISILTLSACVKENTSTVPLNNNVDTNMAASHVSGSFINGPYGSVRGTARVYVQNGAYLLALQQLSSSNGPDLHVYISKEVFPVNFIDLGPLQSISGNQVYNIPGYPDFTQYKYALIHCQRFNHLFGSAELR